MNFLLFLIFAPFIITRWLCWLSIVQQKEYRWDRLLVFSKSESGRIEIPKLFFLPRTKSELKRPKLTSRSIVIIGLSSLLTVGLLWMGFSLPTIIWFVWLTGVLLLVPLLVLTAMLPTQLGFELISRLEQRRAQHKFNQIQPTIIGVTGSYGKTTTKLLIAQVLSKHQPVFATQRSFNTRYSLPRDINRRYQGEKIAILEYAAYRPGEIKYLAELFPPSIAVITGLTDQHLALFGSRQQIVKAKAELAAALTGEKLTLINGADPGTKQIARAGGAERIESYSGPNSKLEIFNADLSSAGRLQFNWQDNRIETQLIGLHYLPAVRAAIHLGLHFGLSEKQIMEALEDYQPETGMIQIKTTRQGAVVIDDGGSTNPRGFAAGLELLSDLKSSERKALLMTAGIVDLGEKSNQIHRRLAVKAKPIVDQVFYCGLAGRGQFQQVFEQNLISSRKQIKANIDQLDKSDILLLEGRIPQNIRNYLGI